MSQCEGRGARRGRAVCERARLCRAEAGAACPAQTPPPAFLRPPAPCAPLPGTRETPSPGPGPGPRRALPRPPSGPAAPSLPRRGLDAARRPAGAAARWRVGSTPLPLPASRRLPPPRPRPGSGSASRGGAPSSPVRLRAAGGGGSPRRGVGAR